MFQDEKKIKIMVVDMRCLYQLVRGEWEFKYLGRELEFKIKF